MISIILPFRNAQSTLPAVLASIRQQTLPHFEIIAINDHCSDNSAEVCKSFPDHRIRVVNNIGSGICDALNTGIDVAQFPFIARMDADDIMPKDRLHMQSKFLCSQPDHAMVGGTVMLYPENLVQSGYQEYVRWQNTVRTAEAVGEQIYVESPFAHPSIMIRTKILRALGGYRCGDFPEDYDLWLRLHASGHKMGKVDSPVLLWRESSDRLSRTDSRYAREAFDRLRAMYLANDPRLNKDRPIAIWGAGRKTRKRAAWLIDKMLPPVSWIDIDPKKIGNTVDGVRVVAPEWLRSVNPTQEKPFVLVYVTNHGAREEIGEFLQRSGYAIGSDYLPVG
ncbi:MAG: glycosyltransferase [Pseudomonadota bacterium]